MNRRYSDVVDHVVVRAREALSKKEEKYHFQYELELSFSKRLPYEVVSRVFREILGCWQGVVNVWRCLNNYLNYQGCRTRHDFCAFFQFVGENVSFSRVKVRCS